MSNNTPLLDTNKMEVTQLGGFYCFVNHADGIATTGFKRKAKLLEYAGKMLATKSALELCRNRNNKFFK